MKNRNVDFGIKTFILKNNLSDNKIYRVINNFSKKVILANQHGDLLTVNLAHTNLTKLGIDKIIVGDYVSYSPIEGKITKVYPRDNILSKVTSSAEKSWHVKSQKQLLASNVDEIWVMIAVDQRFTIEKLERYLETFRISDRDPIILLSKADHITEYKEIKNKIGQAYPTLKVRTVSAYLPETIQQIKKMLIKGNTIAVVGASGVGKSTLLNNLAGKDVNKVSNVRSGDQKGRHTTTSITLNALPDLDIYYIDTPGFKAINSTAQKSNPAVFNDIEALAKNCKFRNCSHLSEPKCAVKAAVQEGTITEEHYQSYINFEKRNKK